MKTSMVFLVVVALFSLGTQATRLAARPTPETYKHDAHDLAKQFEPFLKAYSKGDAAAQDQAFSVFKFPDGKGWFEQYFPSESVQQLAWDGEAEVDEEKAALRTMMGIVERGGRFHANCKPHTEGNEGSVKPRESSVNPLKPVPVEQFNIEMQAGGSGRKFSFLGNFVYVGGAFRYVGKGAFPFWSMPDANDPKKH